MNLNLTTIAVFMHRSHSTGHLLKNVLVVYVLEDCDKAGQFVLHLVLRHSLCGFLQEIVTVFGQLDGRGEKIKLSVWSRWSRASSVVAPIKMHARWTCVCPALTSSGALQIDFGSLKFTTDVSAWQRETSGPKFKKTKTKHFLFFLTEKKI